MTKDMVRSIFSKYEINELSISTLPRIIEELSKLVEDAYDNGLHRAVTEDWDEEDLLNHWEKRGKA